ncbi:glutathione hydrolase 1 proenzyme-like [Dermacentor variabilis]|uniref:glutathione hydrolase 1 proenzyme-like n=1 Tax=Dermacentor variabilis TaxID=34621 RepID=UPI003F5C9149
MVPKSNKTLRIENLRPVSRTSCGGKLLERMVHDRLTPYLEGNGHLPHTMFGFRQHLSTQDVLLLLKGDLLDYLDHRRKSSILAIDVKGAFDNVSHEDILRNLEAVNAGFLAAAVPGELMGYRSMLDTIGSRVPWAELFKDAEALARNGFPVYADLERSLKQNEKAITADEALCEVFCSRLYPENKTTMVINETLRMPALADTLATIAREGHEAFYGGSVGKMLSDDIRRKGGLITLQDLRSYTVKVDDALRRVLHDNVTVLAPPPPAGGILTAFMLAVMDSYRDPEAPTVKSLRDNDETFHRLIEVTKFAFAGRMEIGDPEHIDISAYMDMCSPRSLIIFRGSTL